MLEPLINSMQDLMKELIRDLATHYNLSERQVKFTSDSFVFDSFSKAEVESKVCLEKLTKIPTIAIPVGS